MFSWASLVTQTVMNRPAMQESWVQSLGQDDSLEEGMATHSSILAWRIPWTEEPGVLQFMSQRVDMTAQLTHTNENVLVDSCALMWLSVHVGARGEELSFVGSRVSSVSKPRNREILGWEMKMRERGLRLGEEETPFLSPLGRRRQTFSTKIQIIDLSGFADYSCSRYIPAGKQP